MFGDLCALMVFVVLACICTSLGQYTSRLRFSSFSVVAPFCSVCHVMVVGRPLVEFDYQSLPGFEDYVVKYSGDSRVSPGTSGKYLTGQTELGSTSSSWPSFAERIRQLRTSSLRQNRVLLDTLLGHFTVASFLLPNDGATSSEDDGDDEYHFPDGISQFTDELHTSEGDVPMSPSSDA